MSAVKRQWAENWKHVYENRNNAFGEAAAAGVAAHRWRSMAKSARSGESGSSAAARRRIEKLG